MNPVHRALVSLKAATVTVMRWSRGGGWSWSWSTGTEYDYAKAAGDGRGNAAVMACVRFAQRTMPEAPIVVMERARNGELTPNLEHPLQVRIEQPNDHYSGLHLISAIVADLMLTGNAYIRKIRSGQNRVAALWWVPSTMMEPKWPESDPSVFIGWYEYTVDGQVDKIDQADIIHIRQGFDPQNIRKGLSDLASLLREVATDNEAASWTASVLRNVTPPGVVVTPGKDVTLQQGDADQIKAEFTQKFGGDKRGSVLVLSAEANVKVLSFTPEQMNLRALRQIPEERITAVFGIPAAVIGLGAGLDTTKVGATMTQMREQAYESCLIPLQRLIAAELQLQLVPDFGDPAKLRVQFDLSEVRVLQDDQNALHQRARDDLTAGLLTLNQALGMIGEEPLTGPEGDVRYLPHTITVTAPDDLLAPPAPSIVTLPPPGQQPALPAPGAAEPAIPPVDAAPGKALKSAETEALSDDEIIARYEAGLDVLGDDLADEVFGAFEDLADTVAGRLSGVLGSLNGKANGHTAVLLETKSAVISGLVTVADHADIRSLLRSAVLKAMRQAAEDLAPLTGDKPVRITRNMPAVRAAIADMESRLPGIIDTTGEDFGRLVRRLERRPGSVSLSEVQDALRTYVADTYPGRAAAIARTELSAAHAKGVILVAEKSGLGTRVHISDGDGDGACSARNGTTATLEEAAGIGLLHTNCRLRLIPIISEAA